MKKGTLALLCAAAMTCSLFTGCSNTKTTEQTTAAKTEAQTEAPTVAATEAQTEAQTEPATEAAATEAESVEAIVLEDGVYTVEFNTDSSMFHANEACDGKGTLTVEDGRMTLHVSLASKKILNLYVGKAEDAAKEGAEILEPTLDTVTYSDGTSEEVNGFDIPVEAVGVDFDCALIGSKGKWYDHVISVSDPVPAEE